MNDQATIQVLDYFLKEIGQEYPGFDPEKLATMILKLECARRALGHTNMKSTFIYAHYDSPEFNFVKDMIQREHGRKSTRKNLKGPATRPK